MPASLGDVKQQETNGGRLNHRGKRLASPKLFPENTKFHIVTVAAKKHGHLCWH